MPDRTLKGISGDIVTTYDIANQAKFKQLLAPVAVTADDTGDAVDLYQYSGPGVLVVSVGAVDDGGGTAVLKLQESANGSTGWADISGASVTLDDSDADSLIVVGFTRTHPYVRYDFAETGGTDPSYLVGAFVAHSQS